MTLQSQGGDQDILAHGILADAAAFVEEALQRYPAWMLVVNTAVVTLGLIHVRNLYVNRHKWLTSLKKSVFRLVRSLPGVKQRIQRELAAAKDDLEKDFFKNAGPFGFNELPVKGWSVDSVLEASKDILSLSPYEWKEGKISAGSYSGSDDALTKLLESVYHYAAWTNPLHADIFPGVRKMEAEIVRMTIHSFRGGDSVCGCLTSGGSESILMALKAYRDWGRNVRGIAEPNVVAGVTIHAGFDKAASMLNIRLIKVRLDPKTLQVDVDAMRRAMDSNTIALACSAPEFAHGIMDDIEAVGALGASKGVGVHVDCCMGGYLLPFMEQAGYPIAPFDFTVKGVTSISADTHKYGNSPKGSSVVMYRDAELRRHQYFVTPDWPGGIYASPTIPGSRPGGLVAVCWASLLYHGVEGYVKKTRDIISTARSIKQGLADIPELFLFGDPQASILAVGSDVVNIYSVLEALGTRGWHLMAVQNPPGLMLCVTSLHCKEGLSEAFLRDIKDAVAFVKERPSAPPGQIGKVYGAAASIPDKDLVIDCAKLFLDAYYHTDSSEVLTERRYTSAKKSEIRQGEPLVCKEESSGVAEGEVEVKAEEIVEDLDVVKSEDIVKEVLEVKADESPKEVGEVKAEDIGKEVDEVKAEEITEEVGEVHADVVKEVGRIEAEEIAKVKQENMLQEEVVKRVIPEGEEAISEEVVKDEAAAEGPSGEKDPREGVAKEEAPPEGVVAKDLTAGVVGEETAEDVVKEEPLQDTEQNNTEETTKEEEAWEVVAKEEVQNVEPAKEGVAKEGGQERRAEPASIAA